ncbi:MAG: ABC transporter permease [Desulfovibrionaceae bacterium]|jgi:phospholipid/cholesterol/gamma-HCH transport system permease protein|nr:ABC transporter permease [Desulfovibrionaceae bacterium]
MQDLGKDIAVLGWLVNRLVHCPLRCVFRQKRFYTWELWRHMASVGAGSLGIVSVIAACTGMILALQAAQQLEKVGALSFVANLVGVVIIAELGPLLTAIILAGRSGAAFTAEIATMRISEEIDALYVMGVEPVQYLVFPKMASMAVMLPVLTLWADFVGVFSGGAFSVFFLGLDARAYFEQSASFLQTSDLLAGLVKSLGFGITITLISCWQGFLAREGATDVGVRTTRAVVQSIFLIILLDLFFTALNYLFR